MLTDGHHTEEFISCTLVGHVIHKRMQPVGSTMAAMSRLYVMFPATHIWFYLFMVICLIASALSSIGFIVTPNRGRLYNVCWYGQTGKSVETNDVKCQFVRKNFVA